MRRGSAKLRGVPERVSAAPGLGGNRYVNGMEDRAGGAPGMPALAGVVFLASVPQTGNKAIVSRYMTAAPLMALKITW